VAKGLYHAKNYRVPSAARLNRKHTTKALSCIVKPAHDKARFSHNDSFRAPMVCTARLRSGALLTCRGGGQRVIDW
jgi:hypothetical protein